jgi:hypothetical protein
MSQILSKLAAALTGCTCRCAVWEYHVGTAQPPLLLQKVATTQLSLSRFASTSFTTRHQSLFSNLLEQRTWSKLRRAPLHSISIRMKSWSWSIEPLDAQPLLSLAVDTKTTPDPQAQRYFKLFPLDCSHEFSNIESLLSSIVPPDFSIIIVYLGQASRPQPWIPSQPSDSPPTFFSSSNIALKLLVPGSRFMNLLLVVCVWGETPPFFRLSHAFLSRECPLFSWDNP